MDIHEALGNLLKRDIDRKKAEKRAAAEKEAEHAAEEARQAVIARYERETGQTTVDKAYKTLLRQIKP